MSEWFECDRPGCDAVIGVVGDPEPGDEWWDDYDPIAEHIARHELDDERNDLPDVAGMPTGFLLDVSDDGRFFIAPGSDRLVPSPAAWIDTMAHLASSYAGLAALRHRRVSPG